jgi:hypothetical protein
MRKNIRKEIADAFLKEINDYIEDAGWTIDEHTFFYRDPITNALHHTMTALNIQLDRDLAVNK